MSWAQPEARNGSRSSSTFDLDFWPVRSPTLNLRSYIVTMLHAYLDKSGIHSDSDATAVIAAVGTAAAWDQFAAQWSSLLTDFGIDAWHHRDFCNRRKGYGSLTEIQWLAARDKVSQLLIDAQFFIGGAAIGRDLYERARASGKWRLPSDPYQFCLERCLHQVTKQVYASYADHGIRIYYDAEKQHGPITRELLRWHQTTFQPNYLSQYKTREVQIEFEAGGLSAARAVPDIIAFEACAYIRADTGIPFLGANFTDRPTPEPRPLIKALFNSQRVPLAVTTYTDWYLDFDLSHATEQLPDEAEPLRWR